MRDLKITSISRYLSRTNHILFHLWDIRLRGGLSLSLASEHKVLHAIESQRENVVYDGYLLF